MARLSNTLSIAITAGLATLLLWQQINTPMLQDDDASKPSAAQLPPEESAKPAAADMTLLPVLLPPPPPPPAPQISEAPAEPMVRPLRPASNEVKTVKPELTKVLKAQPPAPRPVAPVEQVLESRSAEQLPKTALQHTLKPKPSPKRRQENLDKPDAASPMVGAPVDAANPTQARQLAETTRDSLDRAEEKLDSMATIRRNLELDVSTSGPEARNGRVLLRLLEHGKGPSIEIAWPDSRTAREKLYNHLSNCLGMTTALMTTDGRLFTASRSGKTGWQPDMDRYSGFLRQPSGAGPRNEKRMIRQIRDLHRLGHNGTAVRLFPRQADAVLLGGLQGIVGNDYASRRSITARYQLAREGIRITDIRVDGQSRQGAVTLANGRCGRRV